MTNKADRSDADTENPPEIRRTVFYDLHKELGGKMVQFAGWEMPIQYSSGIMTEHKHCREKAAWFDVSHMGQVELRGTEIARKLESLVPADLIGLAQGHCRYTFFTNSTGGILDDLIVTNAGDHWYLVVNASMRDQDMAHLRSHLDGVMLSELSEQALFALQGPGAVEIVSEICPAAADLVFMQSCQTCIDGVSCRISRLGYTGEDGFELSIPEAQADQLARLILSHESCSPAGLGARDSLRLEAGLSLYGNDIDTTTTPVEASLTWAVPKRRREEGGFPGDSLISKQIAQGAARKLVGIRPEGRVPARQGAEIYTESGSITGKVTSGGFAPTLGSPVAMGYVNVENANAGTKVLLSVRGKMHPALISTLPFVPHRYKR